MLSFPPAGRQHQQRGYPNDGSPRREVFPLARSAYGNGVSKKRVAWATQAYFQVYRPTNLLGKVEAYMQEKIQNLIWTPPYIPYGPFSPLSGCGDTENNISVYDAKRAGNLKLSWTTFGRDGMGIWRALGKRVVGRQLMAESWLIMSSRKLISGSRTI